jgi:hypothetical protein
MRTTITLDDDVASMLARVRQEEQKPFKQVVNEILRIGLVAKKSGGRQTKVFSTPELAAGKCRYPDLDNVAEILSVAERENYS